MNKAIIAALAIAMIVIVSCNDNTADNGRTNGFSDKPITKADSLEKEVMDVHDVAMGKMGTVRKYRQQLKQRIDSVSAIKPALHGKYLQMLSKMEKDLAEADQAMMDWMDQYVVDSARDNNELRIKYLEAEKVRVGAVTKQVLLSLQRADSLFHKP